MRHGQRLHRSLNTVVSAALVGLGLTGFGLVVGTTSPATAAAPLSCSGVYALQGDDPHDIWEVDAGTGDLSDTGARFDALGDGSVTSLDAMGISGDGRFVYGVGTDGSARLVFRYDRTTAAYTQLGAGPDGAQATDGAVDPVTGTYYYGSVTGSGALRVYDFDPQDGNLGLVATGQVPAQGGDGDWAFDGQGRLYVVAGGTVSYVDQAIPPGRRANPLTLTATRVVTVSDPGEITGAAFGGQGDRNLYLADADRIRSINPATGGVVSSQALTGGGGVVDLASCASPNLIRTQTLFPDGRTDPADDASVTIDGGTGPVLGLDGVTYTIAETGAGTVAPGYLASYDCVDEGSGAVLATGSGTTTDLTVPTGAGPRGSSVTCTFTNRAQEPGVTVEVVAGTPSGDKAGDTIGYTFEVTNTGDVPLTSFEVDDPELGPVTCSGATIAPGETVECTVPDHVLTQDDVNGSTVSTTASVTATTGVAGLPDPSDSDTVVVTIPAAPAIVVTQQAAPPVDVNASGLVDAGDTIAYTFTLRNTGNVPLDSVAIAAPGLPGQVTCGATLLAPGDSTDCESAAVHTITRAEQTAGRVDATVTASGVAPGGAGYTSDPVTTTTAVQQPDPELTVVKTAGPVTDVNGDGLTDAGDTVGYTFLVHNTGNVPLHGVTIVDAAVGSVTCSTTDLVLDASTTCTSDGDHVVTPAEEAAGEVRNVATARATAPDDSVVSSDPSVSVITATAPVATVGLATSVTSVVDVNGDGLTDAGDTVVWDYRLTNTGNVALSALAVSDPKAGTVTCPTAALMPGATLSCTVTPYVVTPADELAGRILNSATASAQGPDGGSTASAPSSTTVDVTAPAPGLQLTTVAATPMDVNGSGNIDAGDTIAYTFGLVNTGNVALTDLAIDDPMLASAQPPVSITCSSAPLGAGGTETCTADAPYAITAAQETGQVVSNTATASGTAPDGTGFASLPSTANVAVTPLSAVLTLNEVTAAPVDANSDGLVDVGDTVTFAFDLTNDGNVPVRTVRVDDDAAGAVVCVPATSIAPGASARCTAAPRRITAADVVAGSIQSVATATGRDPNGLTITSNTASSTITTTAPVASLGLEKQAGTPTDTNGDGITDVGDTIVYTFVETNTGNVPLVGVHVDDARVGGITCSSTGPLAPGDVRTCTSAPYVVSPIDVLGGAVLNSAFLDATDPDGVPVLSAVDSTSTPTTTPRPSLRLVLTAQPPVDVNGSGIVDAGDTIAYSATLSNTGNVPLSAVSVDDSLGQRLTCDALVLAPGAGATCRPATPYVVKVSDEVVGAVADIALGHATDPDGLPITSAAATVSQPVDTPAPSLALDKTAGPVTDANRDGLSDAGDTLTYSFLVTNTGNVPVAGVRIVDPRVAGTTCPTTRLLPGDQVTCTSTAYSITAADVAAGSVDNTARAQGTDPDAGVVRSANDSTTTRTGAPLPALLLHLTQQAPVDVNGSGLVDAGDTIAYSVTVTNNGNVPVSGVVVTDALGLPVTCAATTLGVGETTTCTFSTAYVVTAADQTAGTVTNTAMASGSDPDSLPVSSNTDIATQTVQVPGASLTVAKTATTHDLNGDVITDPGDTIDYSFVVTNNGNVPISTVHIVDSRVTGLTCSTDVLAPGELATCTSATYTVTAADQAAGAVRNTATAAGLDPDGDPVQSAPDTVVTPVGTTTPSLLLDKRALDPVDVNNSGTVDAGDTVLYVFTVTNNGNVPVTAISVDDPTAGSVTCDATSLAPRATTQCRTDQAYTITPAQEAAQVASNTATVAGLDPNGMPVVSDPDTVNVPVTTDAPVLTLAKHAGVPVDANHDSLVDAGDTIAYTFTVSNVGNVPITGVTIDDPLAGAVTCERQNVLSGQTLSCAADSPYVITRADVAVGFVRNTATAAGIGPSGAALQSNDDSTTTVLTAALPAITLAVTQAPPVDVNGSGLVDAGDTIAYSYTVTNTGNVPVTTLVVTDALDFPVTCAATTLLAGATTQCASDHPYTITADDETAGAVLESASAAALDPDDMVVTSNPAKISQTVQTPRPELVVDKTAGKPVDRNGSGLVDAGDTIVYLFLVSNTGDVPISTLHISDAKVGPIECQVAVLVPTAQTTCASAPYSITAADVAAGSVDNTASAAGLDPDGVAVLSDPDSTSTPTTTPGASLTLAKSARLPVDTNSDDLVDAGDTVIYDFVVTNPGNVPLHGIGVQDAKAGRVACQAETLAAGASTSCSSLPYSITRSDQDSGSVDNTASAVALDPDGVIVISPTASTSTPVSTPHAALAIDKKAGTPVDVNRSGLTDAGDTIEYTFLVTNTGDVPVGSIHVVDTLAGAVTCPVATLAVRGSTTCTEDVPYVVTAADVDKGTVLNSATAAGVDPDGDPVVSAPGSTATPTETPHPALGFVKHGFLVDANVNGAGDFGEEIDYTFTITDTGNVPMRDVGVTDDLVGTVTCLKTTLQPGESTTCAPVVPYRISDDDVAVGSADNIATGHGTDPDGGLVVSAPSSTSTPTTPPDLYLSMDMTATWNDLNHNRVVNAGDTITYSFHLVNGSNVTLDQINVDEALDRDQGKKVVVDCLDRTLLFGRDTDCRRHTDYKVTPNDMRKGTVDNSATALGVNGRVVKRSAIDSTSTGTVVVKSSGPSTAIVPSTHGSAPVKGLLKAPKDRRALYLGAMLLLVCSITLMAGLFRRDPFDGS